MAIRVFISIPIPNITGLGPLMDDLQTVRGVRTTPMKQLHITLRFLGDIEEDRIGDVERIVNESLVGIHSSRISLRGIGAFPNERAPRIIWTGVDTQMPLADIAERISVKLKKAGIPFDEKEFKPHITVGRVEGRPNLEHKFSKYRSTEFATYLPPSVNIMKSELAPSGATHTILKVCYFH